MTGSREVGACPLCGGATLAPVATTAPLLAVGGYLVDRVLAKVGVLLTRGRAHGGSRSLQAELRLLGVPDDQAWVVCPTPAAVVDKAILLATDDWHVVDLMLGDRVGVSSRQVRATLSDYVHELVADRIPHSRSSLRRKLHDELGLHLHDDALAVSA